MTDTNEFDPFALVNPSPRDDDEQALHSRLAEIWDTLGKGVLYGIRFYTGEEEARLRNNSTVRNPADIDSRWGRPGPVTAMMTVSADGIGRGDDYRELAAALQAIVPEVAVEIVPWSIQPPEGHVLAR